MRRADPPRTRIVPNTARRQFKASPVNIGLGLAAILLVFWLASLVDPHPTSPHAAANSQGDPVAPVTRRLGGSAGSPSISPAPWTLQPAAHIPAFTSPAVTSLPPLIPGLGLQRALPAIDLERRVDVDPNVGPCAMNTPMLPGLTEQDCSRLHCMWSPKLQQNIDLWFDALHALGPKVFSRPCQAPRGGQAPPAPGTPPKLAVIITVHNHIRTAAQVVLETFRVLGEVESAEIIVVDDGSSEDPALLLHTLQRLHDYFGTAVKHARNEQPRGFGAANTQGISMAAAEYVMLLNSDAFLMKGAAFALLRTIEEDPGIGMVGPLFIGAAHTVSEAGGLLFEDGSPANFARNKAVTHQTNFRRPADYISAACAVLKREVFWQVGGFDARYGRGYFEDTEVAATLWSKGLQVVYQPLAVVYHEEGTTLGTDASEGKQRLMEEGKAKWLSKWGDRGMFEALCMQGVEEEVAARRRMSPKLLWVDDLVPETDHDSGSIRTWHMLKILLENGYDISLQPTAQGRLPCYKQQARFAGIDVLPPGDLKGWVLQRGGECRYDVILVARRYVFEPIRDLLLAACPDVPLIYDTVDLHFLREARDTLTAAATQQAEGSGWNFTSLTKNSIIEWLDSNDPGAQKVKDAQQLELSLVDSAQLTIVVSETERQVVQHYRPNARVHVVSNIHTVEEAHSRCEGRRGVLFVGNLNHPPNQQAIEELLVHIMPMAKKLLPRELQDELVVHVVGANKLTPHLQQILRSAPNVYFHGYLPDSLLRMLYYSVKAVVAPLLSGAGVKGKVNQAMKMGVPVVATPIAIEAMHVVEGETCMVARSREEFAQKIVQVYTDCGLWDKLVEGGSKNVAEFFSVKAAYKQVLQAFEAVGAGPRAVQQREDCMAQIMKMKVQQVVPK